MICLYFFKMHDNLIALVRKKFLDKKNLQSLLISSVHLRYMNGFFACEEKKMRVKIFVLIAWRKRGNLESHPFQRINIIEFTHLVLLHLHPLFLI
jgi:hypothetical protein